MIVMIYGLPRSGKTTLINSLLNELKSSAIHIKIGRIINQFNDDSIYKESYCISNNQKLNEQAIRFVKECNNKYKFILMDCHAGYLSDGLLKDFRPDEYYSLGELFLYLKTPPAIIHQRMIETNGIKDVYEYSLDDIYLYQELELNKIKHITKKYRRDLFIIEDADINEIVRILYEHL